MTALEDSNVPNKEQWDDAIKFMEGTLHRELDVTEEKLGGIIGPGWQERWLYWSSRSKLQVNIEIIFQVNRTRYSLKFVDKVERFKLLIFNVI